MKKLNNKILIAVLAGLVGIFALARVFRAPAREGNLKKELVTLDTAKTTRIKIYTKESSNPIVLERSYAKWRLKQNDKNYTPEQGLASSLLISLTKLQPQKMVTRKKEKWADYQVGDSATRVQVFENETKVADVRIGKIGFNQNAMAMQQQQYGGQGMSSYTYVRLDDETEVYTVDGFLESYFNRSVNDMRDKSLLRLKDELITKITFNYPDSGFVLEKKGKLWMLGTQEADSIKVKSFLSGLTFKNASAFADDFKGNATGDIAISIDGAAGNLASLQAWKRPTDWVVASSLQQGVFFSTEGAGFFSAVFERKKTFERK